VYDAYGNLTSETAAVDCLFGYTGQLYDNATGLQNNLNRWYDPSVGRWMSQDPIGFGGGDANLYRYVGNSPLGYRDPSGLCRDDGNNGGDNNGNPNNNNGGKNDNNGGWKPNRSDRIKPNRNPIIEGGLQGTWISRVRSANPSGVFDTIPAGQRLSTYYPPAGGFLGDPAAETLQPDTLIDRFGLDRGTFASPYGTPVPARALLPGVADAPYSVFRVVNQTFALAPQRPGLANQAWAPSTNFQPASATC
jgi:RHS repeat-associated protein